MMFARKRLVFLFCLTFIPLVSSASDLAVTELTFEYGSIRDLRCDRLTKPLRSEAYRVTQDLQKQWDKEGVPLLATLFNLVGRPHTRSELIVYTTACGYATTSSPLIVDIRRYLPSILNNPEDRSSNLTVVLHEFIHRYLVGTFDFRRSEILAEFSDRDRLFRNHIHLMALMKLVLTESGREDLIAPMVDRVRRSPHYVNAWNVATSVKYYDALIAEVKNLSR